jgi:hypothetical protein
MRSAGFTSASAEPRATHTSSALKRSTFEGELYLIVQNEAGGIVLPCSHDAGEKVRQFFSPP